MVSLGTFISSSVYVHTRQNDIESLINATILKGKKEDINALLIAPNLARFFSGVYIVFVSVHLAIRFITSKRLKLAIRFITSNTQSAINE